MSKYLFQILVFFISLSQHAAAQRQESNTVLGAAVPQITPQSFEDQDPIFIYPNLTTIFQSNFVEETAPGVFNFTALDGNVYTLSLTVAGTGMIGISVDNVIVDSIELKGAAQFHSYVLTCPPPFCEGPPSACPCGPISVISIGNSTLNLGTFYVYVSMNT